MKNIYVALEMDGTEKPVIEQAILFSEKLGGQLTVLHVNDHHAGEMSMMMDAPIKVDEQGVRDQLKTFGFNKLAEQININIIASESIPTAIAEACKDADLLVLGHKRMSTFKANLFDSVDEGIVNHASCPVLVVQK